MVYLNESLINWAHQECWQYLFSFLVWKWLQDTHQNTKWVTVNEIFFSLTSLWEEGYICWCRWKLLGRPAQRDLKVHCMCSLKSFHWSFCLSFTQDNLHILFLWGIGLSLVSIIQRVSSSFRETFSSRKFKESLSSCCTAGGHLLTSYKPTPPFPSAKLCGAPKALSPMTIVFHSGTVLPNVEAWPGS